MRRSILFLACLLAVPGVPSAQPAAPDDAPALLLQKLETSLQAVDRAAFNALFDESIVAAQIDDFAESLFVPNALRTTVRERDRAPLEGVPEGDGYRLVVELFVETQGRARILTVGFDIRRPTGGPAESWRIVGAEGLTSVEGLFRLNVDASTQFVARNLEVTSEDVRLTLAEGTVFQIVSENGVTGLVLIGRGEMRFSPAPETEKGQLRIFAGADTLVAPFESALVRFNPNEYAEHVTRDRMSPVSAPDPRLVRRAQELFAREGPKALSLELTDLSTDMWYLLPPIGDMIADVQTRRFGLLTYARTGIQAEDIMLFSRERRRTFSLYASKAKLAARGRFYTEDDLLEYDVLDYNIEMAVNPETQSIQSRARLALRVRGYGVSTLTLRLAEPLAVSSVVSLEHGRLLYLRVRNQNTIIVNLPRTLDRGADVTLVVTYSGVVPSQGADHETLQFQPGQDDVATGFEPSYLLSNRSYWYPQNPIGDYATATIRITVPRGYASVATGREDATASAEVTLRDLVTMPGGRTTVFRATEPLRYLAFVVSRFTRVAQSTVTVAEPDALPRLDRQRDTVALTVDSNSRQQNRGREVLGTAADIMRFYASLMADAPYPSTTVALIESDLPGGHSPGYFAVVQMPVAGSQLTWRNDPAAFNDFGDFFVAHELAHQWWGQAVGWKNYHEQWISEGFAQYFAALYAQRTRGEETFLDMLRQFRRWTLSTSPEGPVYLGYRLGHIENDSRVFRALVYNKGAGVLHMLRRWLGDDVFFESLRRFYETQKFRKAGTDDLRRVFEETSGRSLERFFERWIYSSDIPRISYTTTLGSDGTSVRFQQLSPQVFDVPVTVTVTYTTGGVQEFVVPITESVVDYRIPAAAPIRNVQVNRDNAALAVFEGR